MREDNPHPATDATTHPPAEAGPSGRPPARRPRSRRAVGAATAFALVLATLLSACGSTDDAAQGSGEQASGTTPTSTPDASKAQEESGPQLAVTVSGDQVTPSGEKMDLGVDQTLHITVTSDRDGELHVHSSPEQELEYTTGTTTLELSIDKPGVVDVEDHVAEALVAQLHVS